MAGRPQKKNLDLFRHENDMRNDTKIKALESRFPEQYGYAIYCKTLEVLCEKEGLRYPLTDMDIELLAGDFMTTSERLKECLDYCFKIGLLQIEDGFMKCEQLEHKHIDILTKRGISNKKIPISSPEIGISDEKIELSSRVKGREVKGSKVKEKEKSIRNIIPPQLEWVVEYCVNERKNNVIPQKFFDHYSARGWMIGKNKMKDWQAAVRTWEQSGYNNPKPETKTGPRLSGIPDNV
jgi:hypothetical protein